MKCPNYAQLESAIIERYRRRETSVEEALVEMYLAGSQKAEDITELLWDEAECWDNEQAQRGVYEQIEVWRNRPLSGAIPMFTWMGSI